MRDSFIFYRSFAESVKDLSNSKRLAIYDAIINYSLYQEEAELSGILSTIFVLIKPQLNANLKRYKNSLKKNMKSNTAGNSLVDNNLDYRKKDTKDKQNCSKHVANDNVNDNDNDNENINEKENKNVNEKENENHHHNGNGNDNENINDNVNDNDNDNGCTEKKRRADVFAAYACDDSLLLASLVNFEKMRSSIKMPLTDYTKRLLTSKLSKLTKNPVRQRAILDVSTLNCWRDIYELKGTEVKGISSPHFDTSRDICKLEEVVLGED